MIVPYFADHVSSHLALSHKQCMLNLFKIYQVLTPLGKQQVTWECNGHLEICIFY